MSTQGDGKKLIPALSSCCVVPAPSPNQFINNPYSILPQNSSTWNVQQQPVGSGFSSTPAAFSNPGMMTQSSSMSMSTNGLDIASKINVMSSTANLTMHQSMLASASTPNSLSMSSMPMNGFVYGQMQTQSLQPNLFQLGKKLVASPVGGWPKRQRQRQPHAKTEPIL